MGTLVGHQSLVVGLQLDLLQLPPLVNAQQEVCVTE